MISRGCAWGFIGAGIADAVLTLFGIHPVGAGHLVAGTILLFLSRGSNG
jgi:hypothetical protein